MAASEAHQGTGVAGTAHPAAGPGVQTDTRLRQVMDALSDYVPGWPRRQSRFMTEGGARVHGVIAQFPDATSVYHAAEAVRDAGFRRWDVHTPFPIHGIEDAMGMRRTKLPIAVFMAGFGGAAAGLLLQWWISGVDYPLVDQGKPQGAWEQFTPILFEFGVLGTAFTALFGMLGLNGLPRWHHPLFSSERFLRCSDDGLFIAIEADDPLFDPEATPRLLAGVGAEAVELVEDRD